VQVAAQAVVDLQLLIGRFAAVVMGVDGEDHGSGPRGGGVCRDGAAFRGPARGACTVRMC
jgi:hypothetical protein